MASPGTALASVASKVRIHTIDRDSPFVVTTSLGFETLIDSLQHGRIAFPGIYGGKAFYIPWHAITFIEEVL